MFDLYILYIFIGVKVNHTSSKNTGQENSAWWELIIYIKGIALFFAKLPPLNLQTFQAPFFKQFFLYIVFFVTTTQPCRTRRKMDFPVNPHNIKIFHV